MPDEQAPPAVPDEQAPPAVPDEQAPPAVPDEQAPPAVPDEQARPARPRGDGRRWTSFVADPPGKDGKPVRALHEQGNDAHRLRVEHDAHTLLIHLGDEYGDGWTAIAVDRSTRQWAVAQGRRQSETAARAYDMLYGPS